MPLLSVGDCAREISTQYKVQLHPKVISDAFYAGQVDSSTCPIVAGRRMVPREFLPNLVAALRRAGKLKAEAA